MRVVSRRSNPVGLALRHRTAVRCYCRPSRPAAPPAAPVTPPPCSSAVQRRVGAQSPLIAASAAGIPPARELEECADEMAAMLDYQMLVAKCVGCAQGVVAWLGVGKAAGVFEQSACLRTDNACARHLCRPPCHAAAALSHWSTPTPSSPAPRILPPHLPAPLDAGTFCSRGRWCSSLLTCRCS